MRTMAPTETKTIYSTAEVAKMARVHKDTLLRWLRGGAISEPTRDRHGWRVFSESQATEVIRYASVGGEASLVREKAPAAITADIRKLEQIDWDFAGAKTDYLTHRIHPYPAKFIPQIPNALIQELSSVGETVADIFCGSGTTLVEALVLKRNAIGLDANPLACMISQAKITRLEPIEVEALRSIVQRAFNQAQTLSLQTENRLFNGLPFKSSAWRPSHEATEFWFEPFVVEELAETLSWCRGLNSEACRKLALTAFSSIIVAVSKQDSDTRYVRREKSIGPGETFKKFSRALEDIVSAAVDFSGIAEPRFRGEVITANLLERPRLDHLDLVVCSPPYPNAFSYHLYHMTRMIWLEMDQPKFKREEIGSHRKYSRKGPGGATAETFRQEMGTIFDWLRQYLRPGRYACFVVGDSTIKGERVNNADLISKVATHRGFREAARINRRMQDTKKAFNPVIGKIKNEQILILQNAA